MKASSPAGPPPPWQEVHRKVLSALDALAASTGWLPTAAAFGVDPVLEQVFQQICEDHGTSPEAYLEAISKNEAQRKELQARISRLEQNPELPRMRREVQRREAERQLHVLYYLLSGNEPPDWVWESLGDEQEQIHEAAESGEERDPELLIQVERALDKLDAGTYGQCEDCGSVILPERLQLIPWAERCASCQHKREGGPVQEAQPRVPVVHF